MSKEIQLTQGQVAIVDDADFDELSRYKWFVIWYPARKVFRAVRSSRLSDGLPRRVIGMPRQIMGVTKREDKVDHRNFNTLDNRRENLRVVDNRANCSHKRRKALGEFTSMYVGVSWDKRGRKWDARIQLNGRIKHLGTFSTDVAASAAYQEALKGALP